MALTLTHLRFAHEIAGSISVADRAAYYAGVVYPDSRRLTGLAPERTHGGDSPADPFAAGLTDFEKGWAAHCYYDLLSRPRYAALVPPTEAASADQHRRWCYTTALKNVEDIQSYDAVGAVPFFRGLAAPEPPRGEDPERLELFYSLNRELYSRRPTLEDYDRFRKGAEMSREQSEFIREFTERLLADSAARREIAAIYPSVMQDMPTGKLRR